MRVAVISDIHSNLPALEAVLAAIDEAAPEELWCLGDVVGYAAQPDECTATVRERCDLCLLGNHDLAVLGELDISSFSSAAAEAAQWTRENASEESLAFLRSLEPQGEREGIAMYHASPRDPIWEYVLSLEQAEQCMEAQDRRLALIGHSHVALFFARPDAEASGRADVKGAQADDGAALDLKAGTWLINPGSVGQPRDGDPRAAWLELDTEEETARYHRVPYEIDRAAEPIAAAGLPRHLGERLYIGQ
jgi:predicted phosphodiesterase